MILRPYPRAVVALFGAALLVSSFAPALSSAADLSGNYTWKPVRLGAGGFVTGFVSHPLNVNVRYCRTDVGNAYRWDTAVNEWAPMVVRTPLGGLPASVTPHPATTGVEAIAVDPQNTNVVLMSLPLNYSQDNGTPSVIGAVFRSTDGGRNFVKGDLNVTMFPNGEHWRNKGECMAVDPNNGSIVYYGSRQNGLWKSVNGGLNWTQLTAGGAPGSTSNVIGVRFDRVSASAVTVYALVVGSGVYKSTDAGATWAVVSAGSTLAGAVGNSTVDSLGNLYVAKHDTNKICKMTRAGVWTELSPNFGSSGNNTNGIAVDPANPGRIFAIGSGGCVSRSINGGPWVQLGDFLKYANTLGWLPQTVNGSSDRWRSNGGITFDASGRLWVCQGNEGVLNVVPSAGNTETAANPLQWTIDSKGIEEFVGRDIELLNGSGDQAIVSMEDGTGFLIENPDTFVTLQSTLASSQLISNGTSVSVCPNNHDYVVIANADIHGTATGQDFSGYSADGGLTWTKFPTRPNASVKAGIVAVSRRNGWSLGSDRLVWYPTGSSAPYWSHNGGATWTLASGFPADPATGILSDGSGFGAYFFKQHSLVADQFVANRFYLYRPSNKSGTFLYRSVDGGVSWTAITGHNLPANAVNSTLISNPLLQDDYWWVNGRQGAGASPLGVWRSTNGGTVYSRLTNVDRAINIAIGKGSGQPGASAFTVYIYGRLTAGSDWGVFRSTDAGANWDRVSYYPAGLIDMPSSIAASLETFGLVYVSFVGNSYVYGRPGKSIAVPNGGFEGGTAWGTWYNSSLSGNPVSVAPSNAAPGGKHHGVIGGVPAHNASAYRLMTGLTNGSHTVRGLFKSGGGHNWLRMSASNYDAAGSTMSVNIPPSNSYMQVELPNIPVGNNKVTINIQSWTTTGGWVNFDQIELFQN